jgi:hypothetical protein
MTTEGKVNNIPWSVAVVVEQLVATAPLHAYLGCSVPFLVPPSGRREMRGEGGSACRIRFHDQILAADGDAVDLSFAGSPVSNGPSQRQD